jgi:glycosyltransferase involved in cell wall biosynthesis
MDLLFVSPWHPWPPTIAGAHQRIFHLVAEISKRHRVTLVTPVHAGTTGATDDPLTDLCVRVIRVPGVQWGSGGASGADPRKTKAGLLGDFLASPLPRTARWRDPALLRVLRQLRLTCRFDVVWVERTFVAELVRQAGFEQIVVDVDDIESVAIKRLLRHYGHTHPVLERWILHAELIKLSSYERRLSRRYTRIVVCKEADRQFFDSNSTRVHVVPNGTEPHSECDRRMEDAATVLFVGNLAHFPNVDAVIHFWHSIWPELQRLHPEAKFLVAGRSAPPALQALHDGQSCVFTGPVPDLDRVYERASLVLVPMRLGSGTRIKVLEALAYGKAMVSTSTGVEGLDLRPDVDVVVADEPQAFAQACARLLGDRDARRRLGATARVRVLDRFGWDTVADAADRVIRLAAKPDPLAI